MFAIGTSLKEARLRRGLDLAAASEATKIRARHLQALEDEQFDVLPGQTYVRGFLKTYADYLDLDGQLYVDEYSSRFWINEDGTPASPRKVRVRRKHHGRIELNMVVLTLVAIAGITALVIAAWSFGSNAAKTAKRPAAAPSTHRAVVRKHEATLVVRAAKGSSLIDVRMLARNGGPGRLLYHGTLAPSTSQTFVERGLWLSVSRPAYVTLSLNGGSPLALASGCPRTVSVTPQQITSVPSCP
jgi:hypothetical protein